MNHRSIFAIISMISIIIIMVGDVAVAKDRNEQVVILHGIARSSSHMEDLAEYLKEQGYDVLNLDYPSTDHTLEALVDFVHYDVSKQIAVDRPVHFVGYSMGGLLVRALINKYRPANLGRVVQLASPNHGSEVADFLQDNILYRNIYGPAGQQLITDQQHFKHLYGQVDYELGVIAGNSTIDPISSAIIPGDDDGKVSLESTKLKGMKDHIVVAASHTFFPGNKAVHRQTEHFLKNGLFKHTAE